MGTWKLNEAKSKLAAGAAKNHTVVYEAAGDSVKVTVDGTNSDGSAAHNEWTGKFDGKDYPMTGAGATMKQTLAFEKTGPNSIKMTTKVAGKPFYVDVLTLSADGKTLTDDGSPVAAKEPVKAVFERQ